MNTSILIVDDEKVFTDAFGEALRITHEKVDCCYTFRDALTCLKKFEYNVCVFDILLPDGSGIDLLKQAMSIPDPPEVILITASNFRNDFLEQELKDFIFDYLQKPLDMDRALKRVQNAIDKHLAEISRKFQAERAANEIHIVGESPGIRKAREMIARLGKVPSPVLITGETGTGKELVARGIHFHGIRREAPFVPVNCSAIPKELFESEFFGFEKGAFSGAFAMKKGLFELADGGTLFLDEIGEMEFGFQSKLLRVLESGEYRRIGARNVRHSNARIIAATHRNLPEEIKRGRFREDLFYRISVIQLHLPALRERKEDIPLLARYLWEKLSRQLKKKMKFPKDNWFEWLKNRPWPGNIRELANEIERTLILGNEYVVSGDGSYRETVPAIGLSNDRLCPLDAVIREHIMFVYEQSEKNKTKAANLLGISLSTLKRRLREMGID